MTDGINRDRCIECTCSGRSDTCVVDSENYALGAVQSEFTTLCTQNSTSCNDGWQLRTAIGQLEDSFVLRSASQFSIDVQNVFVRPTIMEKIGFQIVDSFL